MEKWVWRNVQKLEAEKIVKCILTLALLSLVRHGDILTDAALVQKIIRGLRLYNTSLTLHKAFCYIGIINFY